MTICPRCGVKIDPANSAQPTCRACGLPLQGGESVADLDMSNEQTIHSEEFFPEQLPKTSPPTIGRTIEFQSQEETPL
ncbi:MAG: hypothetical protein NT069_30065, partial [Planctomycetota bacterium]|nr:hypothetical protein [Planctomycetota bacterium]